MDIYLMAQLMKLQGLENKSVHTRAKVAEGQFSVILAKLMASAPGKYSAANITNQLNITLPGVNRAGFQGVGPSAQLKEKAAHYENIVEQAALRHGVNPALCKAVARAESGFNPMATSRSGAMGLMQLMPGTARELGVVNPYDPLENADAGVRYLKEMLQRYKGNETLALAAYNAGPGAVDKHKGVPPYKETRNYIQTVMTNHRSYIG